MTFRLDGHFPIPLHHILALWPYRGVENDAYSYAFNPMLCVTLNGQILRRWVFVVDVTRAVMSVTKELGFPHI